MTKMFLQRKLRWLLLPLLFLGLGTVQAQSFIPQNEIMTQLELKLADIYKGAERGTVLPIDKKIAKKFINKVAMDISNDKSVEAALENAFTATQREYALYSYNIETLKSEIKNLLEKKD